MKPLVSTFKTRKQWLKARLGSIGASDAAKILGESRFGDPISLWMVKTGRAEEKVVNQEAVEFGNILQPVVASVFSKKTGRTVRNPEGVKNGTYVIHQHPKLSFLTASLDYEQIAKDKPGKGALEIKTGHFYTTKLWDDGGAPEEYLIQLQHQLGVTGYQWGSLAVLLGNQDFRWLDVERDDEFIELLFEVEKEFWEHVLNDVPPPPSGEKSIDALARLYKVGNGASVLLPGSFVDIDAEYQSVKKQISDLEKREKELKAKIQAAIGKATFGIVPGGRATYSWKEVNKRSYTVEATTYRELRRKEKKA